jgi:hypothetical protein
MTLAETASIFSQFIIFKGALKEASEQQQLALIESFLQDATQTCVDILSRFYFERELFRVRVEGDIMAGQLSAMMLDAQKASYGNTLDEQALHPYMWAVKGHYYSSDLSFYNFPYAFGQLFGLGVYSLAQVDPENFGVMYDALLLHLSVVILPLKTSGNRVWISSPATLMNFVGLPAIQEYEKAWNCDLKLKNWFPRATASRVIKGKRYLYRELSRVKRSWPKLSRTRETIPARKWLRLLLHRLTVSFLPVPITGCAVVAICNMPLQKPKLSRNS